MLLRDYTVETLAAIYDRLVRQFKEVVDRPTAFSKQVKAFFVNDITLAS